MEKYMSDMTLTLSKETTDTLKKLYEVNQGVKFVKSENTLKVKSTDNSLLVHANIEEEFPRDFYVYDLREFLSVVGIIDKPILDFSNDKYVQIKSEDGTQKLRYIDADPQFVTSYVDKVPKLPSSDIEVAVTKDQFQSVMKAAQTMKLDFVGFVCDGETITLSAFNKNNGDDNQTNNFSIELMDGDTEFEMFYKLDQQNIPVLLGEGDLDFTISEKKISNVKAESGKEFWIALNANSKYGS